MARNSSDPGEEFDPQAADDDGAHWAAARQAVYARKRAMSAPEITAVRLDEAAQSHERIAAMYEEIAERTSDPDDFRGCASRHRSMATEDRQRAAQLRHLAERRATIDWLRLPE